MLIREPRSGIQHFVGQEFQFAITTICNKELMLDEYIVVEGNYTDCNCRKCIEEIDKDLKRRSKKKNIVIKMFPV